MSRHAQLKTISDMLSEDFSSHMTIDQAVEKLNKYHSIYQWLIVHEGENPQVRHWTEMADDIEKKFLQLVTHVQQRHWIMPINPKVYKRYFMDHEGSTSIQYEFEDLKSMNVLSRETIDQLIENHLDRMGIAKGTTFFAFKGIIFKC